MTTIELKIEAHEVKVKNVSQFLSALTIMRDGIELLVNDSANEYANKLSAQFPDLFPTIDSVLDLLKEMGRVVADDHNWPLLPDAHQIILTEALLNVSSETSGLQFVSLQKGSLDGVFSDVFDKIGKIFRNLLGTSSSIVGGGEGAAMKASVRGILAESERSRETQLVAAGVMMMGAEKYKKSLDAMKATAVVVKP